MRTKSLKKNKINVITLGCSKNTYDSEVLMGQLKASGKDVVHEQEGNIVVINTCGFINNAKEESINTILEYVDKKENGIVDKVFVTGCLSERYRPDLEKEIPNVDQYFGTTDLPLLLKALGADYKHELLGERLTTTPKNYAYLKIAEGCDRNCGFCAIPSFRGPQRSRDVSSILAEVEQLQAREIVLVAQDLASYGKDRPSELGAGSIVSLVREVSKMVQRTRLLYLYPSDLSDALIDAICDTGVPYFDLSLQHVSKPLLRRMRRWGDGQRFLNRISDIRSREPDAAFRSNFIVGYPGETEEDHDQLLSFVEQAQLDWCGFFAYSPEDGTYAVDLDGQVPEGLMRERLLELSEMQDNITARRRDDLIGRTLNVLVDEPGEARSHREAPEIDGIIEVPQDLLVGEFYDVEITSAMGPDLVAE